MSHRRTSTFLLLIALALSGTSSASANKYDYDRAHDFSSYQTWAWLDTGDEPTIELGQTKGIEVKAPDNINAQIRQAIEQNLEAQSLSRIEDPDEADFLVGFHTSVSRRFELHEGYRYRRGRRFGVYTTWEVESFPEGTLILDVVDREGDSLVWRARTTRGLDPRKDLGKTIDKAVSKLLRRFPPKAEKR